MMLKSFIFVLVQIEKVIVCKKADFSVFIGYPSLKDLILNAHKEVAMCFKAVYVVSYGSFWSNGRHLVNMSIKEK